MGELLEKEPIALAWRIFGKKNSKTNIVSRNKLIKKKNLTHLFPKSINIIENVAYYTIDHQPFRVSLTKLILLKYIIYFATVHQQFNIFQPFKVCLTKLSRIFICIKMLKKSNCNLFNHLKYVVLISTELNFYLYIYFL